MAIENPCDEREAPSGVVALDPCPPGKIRDESGRCVDQNLYGGLPPVELPRPPRDEPFAVDAITGAPSMPGIPDDSDVATGIININPEIQYKTATRDLTTIDENNFFNITNEAIDYLKKNGNTNGAHLWMSQKADEDVLAKVDKFRLAIMNFWQFDGDSESITVRPVGDPRRDEISRVSPGGDGHRVSRYVPLSFSSNPESGILAATYWSIPIATPEYSLMENLPFSFNKREVDSILRHSWPNITKRSHFMDIYMEGRSSNVWDAQRRSSRGRGRRRNAPRAGRDQSTFWSSNPEKRDFYSTGNIEYDKKFYDYVFDAPGAFFESELDNIVVTPSDTADIKVMAGNLDLHKEVQSELSISNVYQYYQSKQIQQLISDDQGVLEDLPPGQVEYTQRLVLNYEEFDEEGAFQSKSVLKFPSDRVKELQEINEVVRGSLSNFIEINIGTAQGGPINEMLQSLKMDVISLQVLQSNADEAWENLLFETARVSRTFTKVLDDQFLAPSHNVTIERTVNDKAIQNIEETIFQDIDSLIAINEESIGRQVYWPRDLEEFPLYYTGWDNQRRTMLEETIKSQIFIDRMNQHIESAKLERSFADVLYGRKAYSEVIGYKIEKYRIQKNDGGQEIETKIQEFLLMDSDKVKEIEFLDTQVIPERKYRYKIFTINFVIGTKYEYSSQNSAYSWTAADQESVRDDDRGGVIALNVASGRSISLIYAPFFEKVVSLADKPPLFPQVTFLPYQGVDHEHALLLQANHGELLARPIEIFPEDKEIIADTYESQAVQEGQELTYKSDTLPTDFELIRIDTTPETYKDFASPTAVRIKKPATAKTAFFKLDIEPNKYYYYVFRTYDHAGVSNPTRVFRVRMVSYQNGIFMELDPYEMYKKPEEFKMSFEKMIKISPNFEQKMINFETVFQEIDQNQVPGASSLERIRRELGLKTPADTREFQLSSPVKEKVDLGKMPADTSVWDKNFKIRFKSKTTGKKIDVNMVFKKKKTTIVTEE